MSTLVDTLQPPPMEDEIIENSSGRSAHRSWVCSRSCRLKFFFRYVLGLKKPKTAALHVGVTVHAVLSGWNRARWRQESPALADLYADYQTAWKSAQTEEPVAWEPGVESEQQQTGWRLLETFFREVTHP